MKKILILSMAVFLIFGFTSQASADLVINNPSIVQFYADDDSPIKGDANIAITDINFGSSSFGTLEYNVGGTGWTQYSASIINVPTSEPDWRTLIELRILKPDNNYVYSAYKMQFMYENSNLPNHYDRLDIYWTDSLSASVKFDITGNVDGADNLSPVPLPGAVLLLGTGLIGLVGVRRKFRD